MRKSWIKWILIGVVATIGLVVGIPLIISECYKANSGYITIWTAADVLSYYGTILGTLVAVITIVVTIGFTRKQIQRESYIKSEHEKWAKIESIITEALGRINPQHILTEGVDNVAPVNDNFPNAIMTTIQKYQMDCRIATDQLFSYLSSEDFPKMKYLLDQIMQASIIFSDICEKEYVAYRKISDIKARRTALETIELEKKYPNSFTEKDLSFCASVLERTKNLKYDEIWGDIGKASRELADAYDHVYRNLLALKGQVFDSIYTDMRKRAGEILRFGRKNNANS